MASICCCCLLRLKERKGKKWNRDRIQDVRCLEQEAIDLR